MWPRRRASPADHLSRYWTALVAGAPAAELARLAEPLDADVLAVIERMRALRTRHRLAPAFLDRLERESLAVFGRGGTVPARAPLPGTRSVSDDGARPPSPLVVATGRAASSPLGECRAGGRRVRAHCRRTCLLKLR